MKATTIFIFLTILFRAATPAVAQVPLIDSDAIFREVSRSPVRPDNSAKIEALLGQMTIEEKVGQMAQLTIDMVTIGNDQDVKIDEAKLRKAVVDYGVGSILNVNKVAGIVVAMNPGRSRMHSSAITIRTANFHSHI